MNLIKKKSVIWPLLTFFNVGEGILLYFSVQYIEFWQYACLRPVTSGTVARGVFGCCVASVSEKGEVLPQVMWKGEWLACQSGLYVSRCTLIAFFFYIFFLIEKRKETFSRMFILTLSCKSRPEPGMVTKWIDE